MLPGGSLDNVHYPRAENAKSLFKHNPQSWDLVNFRLGGLLAPALRRSGADSVDWCRAAVSFRRTLEQSAC